MLLARALLPLRAVQLPSARQDAQRRGAAAAAARPGREDRYGWQQRTGSSPAPQQPQPPSQQPQGRPQPPLQLGQHASAGPTTDVLAAREWLLRLVPLELYKAVGVSFDGRQERIPLLHKDSAVACVREPTNPYDANAVAIRTLDGQSLGYIAKEKTHHFLQDLCFAAVHSGGQAQSEEAHWGFSIAVQPTMPPAEVLAMPVSLRAAANGLAAALAGQDAWAAAQRGVVAAAQQRCEVSSVVVADPAGSLAPRWRLDDVARVAHLAGFRVLAPEVAACERLLELQEGSAEAAAAAELLRQLNRWHADDLALYLSHTRDLAKRRSARGGTPWRLDLAWLCEHGVAVPEQLQGLCGPPAK